MTRCAGVFGPLKVAMHAQVGVFGGFVNRLDSGHSVRCAFSGPRGKSL